MVFAPPWTYAEKEKLSQIIRGRTHAEAGEILHRSERAVRSMARQLGLTQERLDAWPLERIAEFKRLHATGISFGKIAIELGITRNAAIGKANRLGMTGTAPKKEPKPAAPKAVAQRQRGGRFTVGILPTVTAAPKPEPAPVVVPFAPSNPVSILAVGLYQCRFIVTDGVFPAMMCAEATNGGSWCPHHLQIVSAPPRERLRSAA